MAHDLQPQLSTFTLFAASLEQEEQDIRMKDNVLSTHKDERQRDTRNVTYLKVCFRLSCPLIPENTAHRILTINKPLGSSCSPVSGCCILLGESPMKPQLQPERKDRCGGLVSAEKAVRMSQIPELKALLKT